MQIASSPPTALQPAAGGAAAATDLSGAGATGGPLDGLFAMLGAGETGAQDKPATDDGSAAGLEFAQALAATLVVPAPQPTTPPTSSSSSEAGKAVTVKTPAAPFPYSSLPPSAAISAGAAPPQASPPDAVAASSSLNAAELASLAGVAKPKAPAPTSPQTPSKPGADTPAPVVTAATAASPGPATTAVAGAAAVAIQSDAPVTDPPIQTQVLAANVAATPAEPRVAGKTDTKTASRVQDRNPAGAQTAGATAAQTPAASAVVARPDAQGATDAIDPDAGAASAAGDSPDAPDADAQLKADGSPLPPPVVAAATTQTGHGAARVDATTLPHLASQIIQKSGGKATRFDLELTPAGLGRVDVKVEISASGALTASFSFDNPQAAAELRGRSDELRNALTQAGFDLADNGLSFDMSGGHQRRTQDQQAQTPAFAGRAFAATDTAADDILANVTQAAARLDRRGTNGFDIRI